jgi:membrane protease YdiL (CAAX protease family)
VLILVGLGFAAQASSPDQASQPPDDTFYRHSFALAGIVMLGILLGVVLLIARGLPRRPTFALYRPESWPRMIGLTAGVLVATLVLMGMVAAAIGPAADTDQGIPEFWDGSRAGQFALNFIVVAALVPIVEELTFRGLGFSLLSSKFGSRIALAGTTLLFALAHGFLIALPLFLIVGLALGWLRMRTGSVYPGMLMHGAFNGCVTLLAVTLG